MNTYKSIIGRQGLLKGLRIYKQLGRKPVSKKKKSKGKDAGPLKCVCLVYRGSGKGKKGKNWGRKGRRKGRGSGSVCCISLSLSFLRCVRGFAVSYIRDVSNTNP